MDSRLAKQLLQARKALKQKYKSLKSDIAKSETQLEKTYKPITQPLHELVTTLQTGKVSPHVKQELKEEGSDQQKIPLDYKNPPEYYYTTPVYPEDETFQYDPTTVRTEFGESFFDDTFPTQIADHTGAAELEAYLQKFKSPLPRAYIEGQLEDTNNEYDNTFGVYFDPFTKKYTIGDSAIDFEGADFVINGEKYMGTPGLYELMFKKHPAGHRKTDVETYIKIIRRSNAHYLGYNAERGLSTSNAPKFIDIIKPRITSLHSMSQEKVDKKSTSKPISAIPGAVSRPRASSVTSLSGPVSRPRASSLTTKERVIQTRSKGYKDGLGLTMKEFNNKKVEYTYFDDYNELVERLQLLTASQWAGNTGNDNEITSILEELREGKIIK